MHFPFRAVACAPLCGLVILAAAPVPLPVQPKPVSPAHGSASLAPASPPNGTYTYELSRNGAPQGSTTIAIVRRDERGVIETNETGHLGTATAQIAASFRYNDFSTASYVATYRAPFPHSVPLGAITPVRPHVSFDASTTVRYDVAMGGVRATVDGVSSSYVPFATEPPGQKHEPFVVDAPFMTSVMLAAGYRKRTNAQDYAWYSLAFPDSNAGPAGILSAPVVRLAAAPRFEKTPKTALAMQIGGLGTIWFDAANAIVYEAHFDALNLDAHLTAYARVPETAPLATPQAIATPAHLASRNVVIENDDVRLPGTLDLPATHSSPLPVVVLVPPGPTGNRNFDDDGPQPMFVDIAQAFTARGFAVLRYDPRGTGKGAGGTPAFTWNDERADAVAAIGFAQSDADLDASRVFVLGYGNGADLALASAGGNDATDRVAGVVALAPTSTSYAACARTAGVDLRHPSPWQRSAFAHDPTKLAERTMVPLLVLQPGVGVCGEKADDIAAYDDALRAANANATIVVASDLAQTFGGRFDADSLANTQMFFPYRFDTSTLGAIADWLAGPHDASSTHVKRGIQLPVGRKQTPPPVPERVPQTGTTPNAVSPGVVNVPSAYLTPGSPAPAASDTPPAAADAPAASAAPTPGGAPSSTTPGPVVSATPGSRAAPD